MKNEAEVRMFALEKQLRAFEPSEELDLSNQQCDEIGKEQNAAISSCSWQASIFPTRLKSTTTPLTSHTPRVGNNK